MSKFSWESQICHIKDETNKAKSGWINAKDEKPKDSSSVLIYTKEGGIAEASYNSLNDTWLQFRWSAELKDVEFWMPFPELPRKGV